MKTTSFFLIIFLFFSFLRLPIYAQEFISSPPAAIETPTPILTPELSPTPTQQITPEATENEEITGEASASAVIENDINSQIVGEDIDKKVINVTENSNEQIEVASNTSSPQTEESNKENIAGSDIQLKNDAVVENNVDVTSDTGNVSATESATVASGNATSDVAIINLVNTNIIGSCGFFGIVNIFASQEGDLILPNEEEYLDKPDCTFTPALSGTTLQTENNAEVVNTITAQAESGDNRAQSVTTGPSQTNVTISNTLNTNFIGNHWVYIRITDFGNWSGQLVGLRDAVKQEDGSYIVRYNLPTTSTSSQATDTSLDNQAVIHNTVTAEANTGGNDTQNNEGQIKTGEAKVNVDIFNIANTNIIGSNWYFALVSNFDTFHGNIVIPRPNLIIQQSQDINQIEEGGEVAVRINYLNSGSYPAKNTGITLTFPPYLNVINSGDAVNTGVRLFWNVGTVSPASGGTLMATFKLMHRPDSLDFPFTSSITTSSYEPVTVDNIASGILSFKEKNNDQSAVFQSPLTKLYVTPPASITSTPKNAKVLASVQPPKSEVKTVPRVKGISIKKELPLESSVCMLGLVGCRNIELTFISTLLFGSIVLLRKRKLRR